MPNTTLAEAAATLAAETSGYLAADHTIRRVHQAARGATAAALIANYPATTAFAAGFLRRLREISDSPSSTQGTAQ